MMKVTDLPNDLCFSALSETQMDSNGIKTFIWYQDQKQKLPSKYHQQNYKKKQDDKKKCGNVEMSVNNCLISNHRQQLASDVFAHRKKANVSKKIQVIFLTVKE